MEDDDELRPWEADLASRVRSSCAEIAMSSRLALVIGCRNKSQGLQHKRCCGHGKVCFMGDVVLLRGRPELGFARSVTRLSILLANLRAQLSDDVEDSRGSPDELDALRDRDTSVRL